MRFLDSQSYEFNKDEFIKNYNKVKDDDSLVMILSFDGQAVGLLYCEAEPFKDFDIINSNSDYVVFVKGDLVLYLDEYFMERFDGAKAS